MTEADSKNLKTALEGVDRVENKQREDGDALSRALTRITLLEQRLVQVESKIMSVLASNMGGGSTNGC